MINAKHFNSLEDKEEPEDHSNLYIGIAVVVVVAICWGILVVISLLEVAELVN